MPCAWDVQKSFDFIIIHSICSELWFDGNSKIDKRSTQNLKTDCLFTIQNYRQFFFLSQLMFWFQLNWEFMYLSADLKYGFCNKSFRKDEPLTSWTLLQHINCPHFWAWLLNTTLLQNPYFRTSALSPSTPKLLQPDCFDFNLTVTDNFWMINDLRKKEIHV